MASEGAAKPPAPPPSAPSACGVCPPCTLAASPLSWYKPTVASGAWSTRAVAHADGTAPDSNPNATRFGAWANSDGAFARWMRRVVLTGAMTSMRAIAALNDVQVWEHQTLLTALDQHHNRTGYFAPQPNTTAPHTTTATSTATAAAAPSVGDSSSPPAWVGPGLITVANHVSTLDDPVLLCHMVPAKYLLSVSSCKFTFCAEEICFKSAPLALFFRLGKTIPIRRGAGLYQTGMHEAVDVLRRGQWLNMFPEGRCYPLLGARSVNPIRWGIGKLVTDSALCDCDCATHADAHSTTPATVAPAATTTAAPSAACVCRPAPLVVPWVHSGMDRVMPLGSIFPKFGHRVRVLVGAPLHFNDLIATYHTTARANAGWGEPWPPPREALYAQITQRVEQALQSLTSELHERMRRETEGTLSATARAGAAYTQAMAPAATASFGATNGAASPPSSSPSPSVLTVPPPRGFRL